MGLRWKLGLFVVVFVGGVLGVSGYLSLRSEQEIYLSELEQRGITLLRAFAIPTSVAMANHDISTLDNYVVQFAEATQTLDLRYMAILDYDGQVIAHTKASEFGSVYDDAFTKRAMQSPTEITEVRPHEDGGVMLVAVPITSGPLRWGTIEAAFDMGGVYRASARSRERLGATGVVVSLAAAAVAFLGLSFLVIQPVVRMRRMARRFGQGELSSRVHLRQQDEIGELAEALNRMASEIQEYTESLEAKVRDRTQELEQSNTMLAKLARTDPLTGLYNRRYFMEQLQFEIRRGMRSHHEFALIMMDVDHFKSYNDSHGHQAGDDILQRLAALLQINLRATDLVARYGGEELVVLLLDTGRDEGYRTAEKLRAAVAAQPLPHAETQPLGYVSVSVGVAFFPSDSIDARTLIEYADRALYQSKAGGRDRVTQWSRELS